MKPSFPMATLMHRKTPCVPCNLISPQRTCVFLRRTSGIFTPSLGLNLQCLNIGLTLRSHTPMLFYVALFVNCFSRHSTSVVEGEDAVFSSSSCFLWFPLVSHPLREHEEMSPYSSIQLEWQTSGSCCSTKYSTT